MSDTCGSCDAPIMWRLTMRGKRIPIDTEPLLGGNIVLVGPFRCDFLSRAATVEARESGDLLHQSHFVTCPQADVHRRR